MTKEIFASRSEMMAQVVEPHGIGAEIGVWQGAHAAELIGVCAPRKLYLVDPWEQATEIDPAWDDWRDLVRRRLRNRLEIVDLVQATGAGWLSEQADNSLDWVYCDSSHTLEQTAAELFHCLRVVKPGGIIAGHDLTVEPTAYWGAGVMLAVLELCATGRVEVVGVTNERWPSWAVRVKPKTEKGIEA